MTINNENIISIKMISVLYYVLYQKMLFFNKSKIPDFTLKIKCIFFPWLMIFLSGNLAVLCCTVCNWCCSRPSYYCTHRYQGRGPTCWGVCSGTLVYLHCHQPPRPLVPLYFKWNNQREKFNVGCNCLN